MLDQIERYGAEVDRTSASCAALSLKHAASISYEDLTQINEDRRAIQDLFRREMRRHFCLPRLEDDDLKETRDYDQSGE